MSRWLQSHQMRLSATSVGSVAFSRAWPTLTRLGAPAQMCPSSNVRVQPLTWARTSLCRVINADTMRLSACSCVAAVSSRVLKGVVTVASHEVHARRAIARTFHARRALAVHTCSALRAHTESALNVFHNDSPKLHAGSPCGKECWDGLCRSHRCKQSSHRGSAQCPRVG